MQQQIEKSENTVDTYRLAVRNKNSRPEQMAAHNIKFHFFYNPCSYSDLEVILKEDKNITNLLQP